MISAEAQPRVLRGNPWRLDCGMLCEDDAIDVSSPESAEARDSSLKVCRMVDCRGGAEPDAVALARTDHPGAFIVGDR